MDLSILLVSPSFWLPPNLQLYLRGRTERLCAIATHSKVHVSNVLGFQNKCFVLVRVLCFPKCLVVAGAF